MAEIVKARDMNATGQPVVAVKRILPHLCHDQQYKTMFLDESRVLAQLQHDDIIKTFEIGEVDETPYIALEYIDGQDARMLFHKARKTDERVPIPVACFVIGKLCDGLHHAHEQKDSQGALLGLVHRDVSLQNVLLSYTGDVKVTDFGIAMSSENVARTEVGIVKGKFGYMSPEQIKGAPLDRRSDVFAAGICLYELLTGERLFSGESDYKAVERVRNADVQAPSSINRQIPSALERIVMKALAKHPRDRYQSAQDMSRALTGFTAEAQTGFGKQELGAYMRRTFAEEIAGKGTRNDPTPTPSPRASIPPKAATPAPVPAGPAPAGPAPMSRVQDTEQRAPIIDAATGLAAFDDLEPPSALNVMPEPPPPEPPPRTRTPSMAPGSLSARHSVPPMVPRGDSIPGLPASAFLAAHGRGAARADDMPQLIEAGPGGASSIIRAEQPSALGASTASTVDMDWDEDEPRTQSRGLDGVEPIEDAGDDDVTRQVRIEETFPGLSSVQSGAFPPTLDDTRTPPVSFLDDASAQANRVQYVPRAEPRNHVLVIAIVLGIVLIIAAGLYSFRSPATGSLRFSTEPRDAIVMVDGQRVSSTSSPFVITDLSTGVEHTITVSKPGFSSWSSKIKVHGDKPLELLPVSLDREISALPEPPSAGEPAVPASAGEPSLPIVKPKATAKPASKSERPAAKSEPAQKPRVRPETNASHPPRTASTAGKGFLRINTRPWSRVSVDGKLIGNTPQMSIPLSAGTHKVKLVNPEFGISKTMTVNIAAGQTLTQVLTLQ